MKIHCQESLVIIHSLCSNNEMRKRVHPSHNQWDIINPGFQELQPCTIELPVSLCLLSLYWGFCIPTRCCCCLTLSTLGSLHSSLFFQATPALCGGSPKCTKGSQKNTRMGPDTHQQGSSVDGCKAGVKHIPIRLFRSVFISPLGHKSALSHWQSLYLPFCSLLVILLLRLETKWNEIDAVVTALQPVRCGNKPLVWLLGPDYSLCGWCCDGDCMWGWLAWGIVSSGQTPQTSG